ncbi:MAG: UDP-N-acetylglucosamine diphosphorylase, partial [Chlamydiae bacterium]|nr:UDP-N-acetylglucosamine diphosphorylase [Chlamydiota bacterium]
MNPVSPEALFDLSKYLHKELLMKETEVWNALEKLPIYLKDKKLGKIESEIPKGVTLINPEWISIG